MSFFIFGGTHCILIEPIVEVEEYPIYWKKPPIDLEKLAFLHEVEGLSFRKLAEWANCSPATVRKLLQDRRKFNV